MKIAIMMRAIDQDSGFRAYTEELVESMIKLDKNNFFLLIYRLPKHFGRFSSYPNVKEVLTKPLHKLIWDQVSVPFFAIKERADIIFNPKFSVPLLSPIPVTMGLQEHGFFTNPEYYEKWDVRYQKFMIPRCARKSVHLFPMSHFILEENRRILGMPLENTTVLYSATDDRFKPEKNEEKISDFRKAYQLPAKFILCVTRVDHPGLDGSTSFYGGKNPETAFRAFARIRDKIPHKLVFAGRKVKEYLYHTEGNDVDLEKVEFITWIPYEELHMLYCSADLFINPAPREGCPATVLEAMACGKAMVLASTGGSAEVGMNAALFAEPRNDKDFSEKLLSVILNDNLRKNLENNSLKRATFFQWEKSASLCIEALEKCIRNRSGKNVSVKI
jgi:glycosyltransferase involved in cell wall biosynthesis